MKKTAILIMVIIYGVASAMQMLPCDGARVTVYGIAAEIAESPDGLCDLSGAAVTGASSTTATCMNNIDYIIHYE